MKIKSSVAAAPPLPNKATYWTWLAEKIKKVEVNMLTSHPSGCLSTLSKLARYIQRHPEGLSQRKHPHRPSSVEMLERTD